MSKIKHWVHYLPEVGKPLLNLASDRQKRLDRIARLTNEINTLTCECTAIEREILELSKQGWTMDEINEAQNIVMKQISLNH